MCYILLPSIFDQLRSVEQKSMVIMISPLIALMEEQVAAVKSLGVSAVYAGDQKMSKDKKKKTDK